MKKLNITYDTLVYEDDQPVVGETCYAVEFADNGVADRLLTRGSSGVAVGFLEKLLMSVELFKGRHYVFGSIKHYELVKEG